MATQDSVVSAALNNVQSGINLLATLLAPGANAMTAEVGENGVPLREFLVSNGVNVQSAVGKGTSFRNQEGDPLGLEDPVYPGDRISAVANRGNG